jgi:hypothetical protein
MWGPEGKIPLARRKSRWDGTITTDFEEIVWKGVECIDVIQDREKSQIRMSLVMNFRVA